MPKRKQKYIIPPGTPFGGLPKKVEESEEQITRRDTGARRRETVLKYLGVNGLHFEWGFVKIDYQDLEQESIDRIFSEWQKHTQARGQYIARKTAHERFKKRLEEARAELYQTESPELRHLVQERISALEALCRIPVPNYYIPPQNLQDDTFEDLFPTNPTKLNFADLSQDIIDLCFKYLSLKGIERAMVRRELSDKLMEAKIEIPEGMTAEDFATQTANANLPF